MDGGCGEGDKTDSVQLNSQQGEAAMPHDAKSTPATKANDVIQEESDIELMDLGEPEFAVDGGDKSENNFQVFTPDFVVQDMIDRIGRDYLNDPKTTVLEPSSGDGAFVAKILDSRLESLENERETYKANSLRAISTLYSVEIDEELVRRQRSNVYTVFLSRARRMGFAEDESYLRTATMIITHNIVWAMFNMEAPNTPIQVEVAYKMPEAAKDKKSSLEFPVWTISDNLKCEMKMEAVGYYRRWRWSAEGLRSLPHAVGERTGLRGALRHTGDDNERR